MKNGIQHSLKTSVMGLAFSLLAVPFAFSQDADKASAVEHVFTEAINDSIQVEVFVKYDQEGLPEHYFCHVDTPVCEHGLCKLMILDVYWDVLGNFLKYETPPGEPLTKFDHHEFTEEDHQKLYGILADRASILRDYPVDDLVDRQLVKKSDVVDAVSAATRVGVKDAIVAGAVYSTYTLWHIVNGPIAARIESHTAPMFSEALLIKMFQSDNIHYQYFALNHFDEEKMEAYVPYLIRLVNAGLDYVPYFAIEKLPGSVWSHEGYQVTLLKHFGEADFKLQNAMLGKMADARLSAEALDVLVSAADRITDKQLEKVLEILGHNRERLSSATLTKLSEYAAHADEKIATGVKLLMKAARNGSKGR